MRICNDNDPFKDKVAQLEAAKCIKPRDPKTGRFIRINPEVAKPLKQPAQARIQTGLSGLENPVRFHRKLQEFSRKSLYYK